MIEYWKNLSLENLFYIDENGVVQEEEWRWAVGMNEVYKVSNLGRAKVESKYIPHFRGGKRLLKAKILKQYLGKKGYLYYTFSPEYGVKINKTIHRLVAEAFIDNPFNLPQINHKDKNGTKWYNVVWNLEWSTVKQNIAHSWENGLNKSVSGEAHKKCRLTKEQVLEIRAIGRTKTQVELSKLYNVGHASIAKILNNKTWTHI